MAAISITTADGTIQLPIKRKKINIGGLCVYTIRERASDVLVYVGITSHTLQHRSRVIAYSYNRWLLEKKFKLRPDGSEHKLMEYIYEKNTAANHPIDLMLEPVAEGLTVGEANNVRREYLEKNYALINSRLNKILIDESESFKQIDLKHSAKKAQQ